MFDRLGLFRGRLVGQRHISFLVSLLEISLDTLDLSRAEAISTMNGKLAEVRAVPVAGCPNRGPIVGTEVSDSVSRFGPTHRSWQARQASVDLTDAC